MGRRSELAELRELHRTVWGETSYAHHVDDRRRTSRRPAGYALVAVGLVVLGVAWLSAGGAGEHTPVSDGAARGEHPSTSTGSRRAPTSTATPSTLTPSTAPTSTAATSTLTSTRPTAIVPSTVVTRVRGPLARTGALTGPLLVVAAACMATGVMLLAGRRDDGS